jgi:pilus assembly protein CpaC
VREVKTAMMRPSRQAGSSVPVILLCLLLVAALPAEGFGGSSRITINNTVAEKLNLTVGRSLIIDDPGPGNIVFASAAPEIVEVMRLPTGQVYLRGLAPGITNISILEKKKVSAIYDIEVTPDISRLKETLGELLPTEKNILVSADNDRLTLHGSVSSAANRDKVLALASAYYPEKITDLLNIPQGVAPDVLLKEKFHEILPEETDIRVGRTGGKIMLTGTVSSAVNLSQVLHIAETFAGGPEKILNLLEIGGVQQVMLEVRLAEMSRGLDRSLGINFAYLSDSGQNFGASVLSNLSSLNFDDEQGTLTSTASGSINALFRFFGYDTTWTVFIDALQDNGLVKILAEPNLITTSGQSAEFLAGGEFPIPVPQDLGVVTIDYKTFGVGLAFTPTVLSNNKISMRVSPEVSEIDFSTAVAAGGVAVPGLTTRRLSTTIELADGQSFAIAGLLQHDVRQLVSKFPLLGDIPVLGALFRSTKFQKNETELVVIATVHLVKPLDMSRQTLPTDQYVEPDDFEFYMLGRVEGAGSDEAVLPQAGAGPATGGMEGDFGHILPK